MKGFNKGITTVYMTAAAVFFTIELEEEDDGHR
jgi:hypothetical protein